MAEEQKQFFYFGFLLIAPTRGQSWGCSTWVVFQCGKMCMFVWHQTAASHHCRKTEEGSETEMLEKLPQHSSLHAGFTE